MQKIILAALCCLLFSSVSGQGKHLKTWCGRQYAGQKTQVTIPRFILRFCAREPELQPFVKNMRSLKIVSMEQRTAQKTWARGLDKALLADGYEELLSVREEDSQLGIYITSTGERIHSVLLAVKDKTELVLLSAKVNMTMQQLEKLLSGSGKEQLKGLASLR